MSTFVGWIFNYKWAIGCGILHQFRLLDSVCSMPEIQIIHHLHNSIQKFIRNNYLSKKLTKFKQHLSFESCIFPLRETGIHHPSHKSTVGSSTCHFEILANKHINDGVWVTLKYVQWVIQRMEVESFYMKQTTPIRQLQGTEPIITSNIRKSSNIG